MGPTAAINRPTDLAARDRDVNTKLQLYGILQAFSNGKVPSNKQVDIALNSFLESQVLNSPPKELSEEGRALIGDFKDVIEKAKQLLLSKNEGNLIQDFIWQCQKINGSNASIPGVPVEKETAKQHGNEALQGLKTLGTLLISNGQFRKLLSDAQILIRDIAGDAAQSAASRVNPSGDALNQIDEPAEDNLWHDTPDLSSETIKAQLRSQYEKNRPFGKKDLQQVGENTANSANQQVDARNGVTNSDGTIDTPATRDVTGNVYDQATDQLKDNYHQNVPDETKRNIEETKDQAQAQKNKTVAKTKDYLGKKMPEERRQRTIWRLKKMVIEIQGHADYQQAIETLLTLAETYGGHGKQWSTQSVNSLKDAHEDNALQIAEADLKTLIERFANSTSTDDLWDSINNIYKDADRDPELKNWFKSLDAYIRKVLQEQGYIMQEDANEEWNRLYDQGRYLLRERYRDHTNRVLDEVKFLADQFEQDPQNKAFGLSVQKLFKDLGNDENGKPVFKPHLLKDVTEVILPTVFENIRYVPLPRIEVSDPTIDAVVENLIIESDNLMPNAIEFGSDNYFRWGRKKISNKRNSTIMISASGMQMDLKDVSYYIKKKQGFPSITDTGVMDVFLGGEGFSFKLVASTAQKNDSQHFAKVDRVDVKINNLKIKVKKSNHKFLFAIAKPILLKVMRPAIQKVLEKQIKDSFTKADTFAWEVQSSVQKALDAAKEDPENAPGIFQQYTAAIQNQLTTKKQQVVQAATNTTVNMAVTKDDAVFKDVHLPGGISTKATEYKQLATQGYKWESPIFDLGSAKPSGNIPKIASITRKPHSATTPQLH